jgi:sulfur-carrier protein adenylyltransferase/sulfurtransferase
VPLATLPEALDTLDPSREVVVYCKGGTRSRAAATHLADAGFSRVANLSGGILRWREDVDPSLSRY